MFSLNRTNFRLGLICVLLALPVHPAASRAAEPSQAPGFSVSNMDKSVDPCVDFYQYACGAWMKNNPIPPDRGSYGRSRELQEYNLTVLKGILEKASASDPNRSPVIQKIGDLYASCMDEKGADAKGASPILPELEWIAKVKSKSELAALVARQHSQGAVIIMGRGGAPPTAFNFGSQGDFKDASMVVASSDQGGLGLPDRDYYLQNDEKSKELRRQYQEHLTKTFQLLGDPLDKANAAAKNVMEIETALAKGSLERVKRREPKNLDHTMSRKEFMALAPSFAWDQYFLGIGAPDFQSLNVAVPDFFKGLETQIQDSSLEAWKDYLRWHVTAAWSPYLSAPFVQEAFDFYGKTLGGAKEIPARWKRCVELVDQNLGEALGQPYVEAKFGADGKERMLKMVQALENSLNQDIQTLEWMTEATRKQALVKLAAITNKIGYPDKWRDYSSVTIDRESLLLNVQAARNFEVKRDLAKIGKALDKSEWEMSPPTVNAYYNPQMNNINFPAGILQPPYFDRSMDDAVNYGAIGMVIGHELTHGFDDQGRQFDAQGNLRDWWTPADAKEFEKRASCIVQEYASFPILGDLRMNGKLTLGENTADNGGIRIAYMALMDTLKDTKVEPIDGFTPAQRFFLGNAQVWCANMSDAETRLRVTTDPHSLPKYRVNGVVANLPEFSQAFGCKAGSPMVKADRCRVW
ncbi:MAG: M13 family metallopeptidase [Acidobacteria bacterium]|nr:M13 family metallopeptidase [Acidobacteriota bacterium]